MQATAQKNANLSVNQVTKGQIFPLSQLYGTLHNIKAVADKGCQGKENTMRFDKDKLNELVTLPDDELWKTVVEIARSHGIVLPGKTPDHAELEKLRAIARDGSKMNVGLAMKMLSKYRRN